MSVIKDYDNWKAHYKAMIDGKLLPNQKIYILGSDSQGQIGKGLQLVSSAAQKDAMTRAVVKKKSINSKLKRNTNHSTSKLRRRHTSKTRQEKLNLKKPVRRRR